MAIRVIVIAVAILIVVPAAAYGWTLFRPTAIRTEIDIDAPPERVWAVLSDFSAYPAWNPFIVSASGEPRPGERLANRLAPSNGDAMTIRPTVLVANPGQELRWRGRLLMPGIVDGEHYFQLIPLPSGGTRFVHGETFTGALVPFAGSVLDVEADFAAMNAALKRRVEDG